MRILRSDLKRHFSIKTTSSAAKRPPVSTKHKKWQSKSASKKMKIKPQIDKGLNMSKTQKNLLPLKRIKTKSAIIREKKKMNKVES